MDNLAVGILFSVFLKWSTGLFGYSGQGKPPMFGDYEAQRHWMEITLNLPINEWYFDTKDNDLNYWGIDYPPLTAYHSLLMGYIANYTNPEYVALNTSRGYESPDHKLFMRYTVLISDLFTFILGIVLHHQINSIRKNRSLSIEVFFMLTYPGLILIDYGHFQYNCVSLGLALMAFETMAAGFDVIGCVLFCAAISYKQMLLYLSLPFFFYQLGKCKNAGVMNGLLRLLKIAASVLITFGVIWYPVGSEPKQLLQVLHRIFPIYRGVFEDKVSNLWCLVDVFLKFRRRFSNKQVAFMCAVMTLLSCLPSCVHLFLKPSKNRFNLSLIICSLAFFLFSYHVHEKTILIVALPVMLYSKSDPFHSFWFLLISTSTMFPLLDKDGLVIPFISLTILFSISFNMFYGFSPNGSLSKHSFFPKNLEHILFILSSLSCIVLLTFSKVFEPPKNYPDLYPLLISCFGAVHFLYFFVYYNYTQLFVMNKKES